VEITLQPTVKPVDEADYELWDDIENTVNIAIEPNSQVPSYRFMGEDLERNANSTCRRREGEEEREEREEGEIVGMLFFNSFFL
jgi:hypothetical protein